MTADLAGTPVTANVILPEGATATGMLPDDVSPETGATLLDPAIMGPPIVWLASDKADVEQWRSHGIHDTPANARLAIEALALRAVLEQPTLADA